MRALAIDTSTDLARVALWDGGSCVVRMPERSDESPPRPAADARNQDTREAGAAPSRHAERLLGLIDGGLSLAGWSKRSIDLVACDVGPGSFTGVRVGVATAKGIALALDRPIVGVGSLEAMAAALLLRPTAELENIEAVVALLDARKGEVFWAAYGRDGALLDGPGHIVRAGVGDIVDRVAGESTLAPRIVLIGELSGELAPIGARVVRAPETDRPDPVVVARVAAAKLESRGPDDLHALEPLYVRPPDITLPQR